MLGNTPQRTPLTVWWIVWAAVLAALVILYVAFGRSPLPPANRADLANLVGFVPLFVSIIIRWLVLPRFNDLTRAFPMFVIGLGLAEACGILGIFMGGPYRDALWILGVLGVTSYVPVFARRLGEPKVSGFIPNN